SNQDKLCWGRYAQGIVPDDKADCWDRTHAFFAFLKDEGAVDANCKDCENVVEMKLPKERQAISKWLPVKNQDGALVKDKFEELRARCVQQGLRLPTSAEIGKLPSNLTAEVAPGSCLWSQTSDFALTNGRLARAFNQSDPNSPGLI